MKTVLVEVVQGIDETGQPEEMTWDLFPLVESTLTAHLDENGLPKIGTCIAPGMPVVGKIGKTRLFDPARKPSALEKAGLSHGELRSKYGDMWKDTSLYATESTTGIVLRTELRQGRLLEARVWIGKEE